MDDKANTKETQDQSTPKDGITTLREQFGVALRLWTSKAPREVGGEISAVFLQDTSPPRVVILHQMPGVRFTLWEKSL